MMKIEKIVDFNPVSEEADVIVTDGCFQVLCFCHPCTVQVGQILTKPLWPFDENDVMRSSNHEYKIQKTQHSYFSYDLIGKLINKEHGIVVIGELYFDLAGSVPKDIEENEYIEFSVSRIDIS